MRKLTLFALAVAALVLPSCAYHHVLDPDGNEERMYVDWETDTRYWGAHFHQYGE